MHRRVERGAMLQQKCETCGASRLSDLRRKCLIINDKT